MTHIKQSFIDIVPNPGLHLHHHNITLEPFDPEAEDSSNSITSTTTAHCGVCQGLMLYPIALFPCSHIICYACVLRTCKTRGSFSWEDHAGSGGKQTTPFCPQCGIPIQSLGLDSLTLLSSGAIKTTCPYCKEQHCLSTLDQHFLQCELTPMRCPNHSRGCHVWMTPSEKSSHLVECPYQEVNCPFCGKVYEQRYLDAHKHRCQFKPLLCNICNELVQDLPKHQIECPARLVQCALGCMGIRADALADHLADHELIGLHLSRASNQIIQTERNTLDFLDELQASEAEIRDLDHIDIDSISQKLTSPIPLLGDELSALQREQDQDCVDRDHSHIKLSVLSSQADGKVLLMKALIVLANSAKERPLLRGSKRVVARTLSLTARTASGQDAGCLDLLNVIWENYSIGAGKNISCPVAFLRYIPRVSGNSTVSVSVHGIVGSKDFDIESPLAMVPLFPSLPPGLTVPHVRSIHASGPGRSCLFTLPTEFRGVKVTARFKFQSNSTPDRVLVGAAQRVRPSAQAGALSANSDLSLHMFRLDGFQVTASASPPFTGPLRNTKAPVRRCGPARPTSTITCVLAPLARSFVLHVSVDQLRLPPFYLAPQLSPGPTLAVMVVAGAMMEMEMEM
eukprot:gnl/Dysnectes_brevis/4962_a6926_421.p1 GENE.gnl/Dysnectes_brevis/4962_a6926_421~~gnl/Dysnectes_brevis/4962_a6926_421.p1  ORF type:complete len:639 (+),score=132.76 gnl/Dysnectes_brevis/4962_a6926_421:46-1917(+)